MRVLNLTNSCLYWGTCSCLHLKLSRKLLSARCWWFSFSVHPFRYAFPALFSPEICCCLSSLATVCGSHLPGLVFVDLKQSRETDLWRPQNGEPTAGSRLGNRPGVEMDVCLSPQPGCAPSLVVWPGARAQPCACVPCFPLRHRL